MSKVPGKKIHAPGTTLADPVAEDWKPDLKNSGYEIQEYLRKQGAYDMFDGLLKDLLINQPDDPLQHMLRCLEAGNYTTGPLQVIVCGAPGAGRTPLAEQLAGHFGLEHISAGEVLREAGVKTDAIGYADDKQVSELVMDRLKDCSARMQGWVLEGYPRTRVQTTYLKENHLIPTHILLLKMTMEQITERQQMIADGRLEGTYIAPAALDQKLRLYTCHNAAALETYDGRIRNIDMSMGEAKVWADMVSTVRTKPRSKGPMRPPRVVLLGPRGVGLREHASRLACRLGVVFVDGAALAASAGSLPKKGQAKSEAKALIDGFDAVTARLRQSDCASLGWVLCDYPNAQETATMLASDVRLAPTRVVGLVAALDTCMMRLRQTLTDSLTGKVWTTKPSCPEVRKRLKRNACDQPDAVTAMHAAYMGGLPSILEALCGAEEETSFCTKFNADGPPFDVFREIAEFVERPPPQPSLPPSMSS